MAGLLGGFKKEEWLNGFPGIQFVVTAKDRNLKPWGDAEIEEFARQNPEEGKNLKAIRSAGMTSLAGAAAGAATMSLMLMRSTKSIVGAGAGAFAGFIGGFIVSEQATAFTHGMANINVTATNRAFYDWLEKRD